MKYNLEANISVDFFVGSKSKHFFEPKDYLQFCLTFEEFEVEEFYVVQVMDKNSCIEYLEDGLNIKEDVLPEPGNLYVTSIDQSIPKLIEYILLQINTIISNFILNKKKDLLQKKSNRIEHSEISSILLEMEKVAWPVYTDTFSSYYVSQDITPINIQIEYAYEGNYSNRKNKISDLQNYIPSDIIFWELHICFKISAPNIKNFEPFYIFRTYTTLENLKLKMNEYFLKVIDGFVRPIHFSLVKAYNYPVIKNDKFWFDYIVEGMDEKSIMNRLGNYFHIELNSPL